MKDTTKTDVLFLIENSQDLLLDIENLPIEIKNLLDFYIFEYKGKQSIERTIECKNACEKIGYTFSFNCIEEPYNLIKLDEPKNVFAYFPDESDFNDKNLRTSYAHIGQHSSCHVEYAMDCDKATKEQYSGLAKELESIGYNLNILNN